MKKIILILMILTISAMSIEMLDKYFMLLKEINIIILVLIKKLWESRRYYVILIQ